MAESMNSEPDNRDSGDPEEARESSTREVDGETESHQADNRGLSADNVSGEDGDGVLNPGRVEGQGELDVAPLEDNVGQSEDCVAEDDDQRPGKATSDTYQIFSKEFRDSQVKELDTLLSSFDEDIEGLRETKDQMMEALLAISGSSPGTNPDEAAETVAKAVEKRQEDFISRLKELRGDIAEEVDFAKWRHEPADDRDRRPGKEDDGTSPFK